MIPLRALLALLAASFLAQAQSQPGPAVKPITQIPDEVTYEFFFQRVASLSGLAGRPGPAGVAGAAVLAKIQAGAQLSPGDLQALVAFAVDCHSQVTATTSAAKALTAASRSQGAGNGPVSPSTKSQLSTLQSQREQTVEDHVAALEQALGDSQFSILDSYVRRTMAVRGVQIARPAQSQK